MKYGMPRIRSRAGNELRNLLAQRQAAAQELHDKRKAELWRVEKLGDLPDVTFEEACLRWLEEKADKKSLDSDKSRIEFWLEHLRV
ncbi:site-specific recombinase, phage integrase family protein [Escherichia coli]|uniref:Site-specific recombinase, phage integrase family protein n=1 Tax=Escherichia coli TaxID=562 RepID=A0A376TKS6_ECOLX|nr:site-specific recombinase, phage integrase family protein [Escherichia coli]